MVRSGPPGTRLEPRTGRGPFNFQNGALAAAILALTLSLAAPALAAERSAEDRQALADLAYVLGQSHALRQACEGQADQFWRTRMYRLLQAEQPDPVLEHRLKDSFNTGYAAAQSAYPACSPQSRRAEARAAERGRALVAGLAGE
ncbi:TIGR02301 family protein [Phenylobacterium montanum]|uniref:TIGR02301 family protein n=1 Tax=Phenylobacterium montanum TaxID=2823693 RepID=A0A975FYF8_9CAUL|nr:TIGR02301 family protein [Caulobacter sp. S6]QUD87595.1 TIGR02301 family protein [Caulobacter sp. S6]